MAKKKRNRRRSSLIPIIAIGVGIYLLTRPAKVRQNTPPVNVPLPALPPGNQVPVINGQRQYRLPQYA